MHKIQVTLQDQTGLPRDRYVNTFYVHSITPYTDVDATLTAINTAVADFYEALALNNVWPGQVSGNGHTVKAYDMLIPEGTRAPISPVLFTISSVLPALPAEVALVLTLEAEPQAGVLPQSTKGRVFLGPLATGTVGTVGANEGGRPAGATLAAVVNNADAMRTAINALSGATLCVASQRQDLADLAVGARQAYPVRAFSCDNAWDTQRSRGNRASLRLRGPVDPAPGLPRSW